MHNIKRHLTTARVIVALSAAGLTLQGGANGVYHGFVMPMTGAFMFPIPPNCRAVVSSSRWR